MTRLAMITLCFAFLTGCMNITASMQPEDTSVKEVRMVDDCAPILLGLGFGHASFDQAMRAPVGGSAVTPPARADGTVYPNAIAQPVAIPVTLTKIRRVQLHDYQFMGFGARCVEVVGE